MSGAVGGASASRRELVELRGTSLATFLDMLAIRFTARQSKVDDAKEKGRLLDLNYTRFWGYIIIQAQGRRHSHLVVIRLLYTVPP